MARRSHILLVEDSPDDEALFVREVERLSKNMKVTIAHDGREAVALLTGDASASLPAVVVLDWNVPALHGSDVLKAIRSNELTAMLPVVVFTSSKHESDIGKAYDSGANSFVSKPVDGGRFRESIRAILRYWLSVNEIPGVRA